MTDTESVPGHGQGGGQLPPITDPYVTAAGDTLPGVAERAGHAGEWLELALANIGQVDEADLSDMAKAHLVAERGQQAGAVLMLPAGWAPQTEPAATEPAATEPAESVPLDTLTAAELVDLASSAMTLAELDAIDAAARGRITVETAVDSRRQVLLGQGATA